MCWIQRASFRPTCQARSPAAVSVSAAYACRTLHACCFGCVASYVCAALRISVCAAHGSLSPSLSLSVSVCVCGCVGVFSPNLLCIMCCTWARQNHVCSNTCHTAYILLREAARALHTPTLRVPLAGSAEWTAAHCAQLAGIPCMPRRHRRTHSMCVLRIVCLRLIHAVAVLCDFRHGCM